MERNSQQVRIITNETRRELVRHGSDEYPFQYYMEDVWLYDLHCVDWHWHSEVEVLYVEEGTVICLIGSGRYVLHPGMGMFINTQVIHRFEAEASAVTPNIVFSPSLIAPEGSLIDRKYIRPILGSAMECLIFSPDVPWQSDVLHTLLSIFAVQDTGDGCEIKTAELLLQLWGTIYGHVCVTEAFPASRASAHSRAQLQIMLQYIHENYAQHISLDDIAGTVTLSKSSVLNLFSRYLHVSPISYLVQYRLKRAAKLLAATEDGTSAVAQASGFENTGYFCRRFKELFHVTPGEYRKRCRLEAGQP